MQPIWTLIVGFALTIASLWPTMLHFLPFTRQPVASSSQFTGMPAQNPFQIIYETSGRATEFAKSSNTLYIDYGQGYVPIDMSDLEFSGIDLKTLSAVGNTDYLKDKNHVYIVTVQFMGIIPGADPATFCILNDTNGDETDYAMDKLHIYKGDKIITRQELPPSIIPSAKYCDD